MRGLAVLLFLVLFLSCKKESQLPPIDHAVDLDGVKINDSALLNPVNYLVSRSSLTGSSLAAALAKPVFIAVHGFSASSFEFQEFHSYCGAKGDVLVSRVLLGGHGRDYEDFRKASWKDWQQPIIDEFKALQAMGFHKIHFIAASTGCPLVLEALKENKIDLSQVSNVVMIDPIIVPSNKQLSLAPVLGGTAVHYTKTDLSTAENGYWYKFRPQEALKELNKLTKAMRHALEEGIDLPPHISITVYKSTQDGSADPVSAVILEEGLSNCEVKMVDSDLHVFTRLKGRDQIKGSDRELQTKTFDEIYANK